MPALQWMLVAVGLTGIAVTVLPFVRSDARWIRIWDFPRPQIAAVLGALLLAWPLVLPIGSAPSQLFAAALALAVAWQVSRMLPFTPFTAVQAAATRQCGMDDRIRMLIANVLVENENATPLLALVKRTEPDLVLLAEGNARWDRDLEPLAADYRYAVRHPQENSYGMHLFSRLELIAPTVRFLIDPEVPSIKTAIRLRSGAQVTLHAVHPKPPPLHDTAGRDAELVLVAREVRRDGRPAIVAGDLNDVAWSHTNRLFQNISGLLDPRIGRGLYSTFHARWPLMRWPLDHVFFERSFRLLDLAVMDTIGSDHFPLLITLCHDSAAAQSQPHPQADAADAREADKIVEDGRSEAGNE